MNRILVLFQRSGVGTRKMPYRIWAICQAHKKEWKNDKDLAYHTIASIRFSRDVGNEKHYPSQKN